MADPRQMEDFDPSDLSQRPEGWRQWKARADWVRDQLDEILEALKPFETFGTACRRMLEMKPDHKITQGSPMAARQIYARDFLALLDALAAYQPHDAGPGGPASEEASK